MIAHHWTVDEAYTGPEEDCYGGDVVSFPEFFTDPKNAWELVGLKPCCVIEGESWNVIMQKYYDHMDWGVYRPFEAS